MFKWSTIKPRAFSRWEYLHNNNTDFDDVIIWKAFFYSISISSRKRKEFECSFPMCMSLCYFIYVVLALVLTAETEAITLFVCIVLCYVMNPTDVYVTDNRKKRSDYYMNIQKERVCVCERERKRESRQSVSYSIGMICLELDWIEFIDSIYS